MDLQIINIAANTKNDKKIKNFTHKSKYKNSLCGDQIEIRLIVKKNKILDIGYQSQACIYCQASASLFSNKIENLDKNNLLKLDTLLKKSFKEKVSFDKKYSFLKQLFNMENYKRSDCILLPLNAILKAINK